MWSSFRGCCGVRVVLLLWLPCSIAQLAGGGGEGRMGRTAYFTSPPRLNYSTEKATYHNRIDPEGGRHPASKPVIEGYSQALGLYLHGITNKELGVPTLHQLLARAEFILPLTNYTNTVESAANRISDKLQKYSGLVARLKTAVETTDLAALPTAVRCCDLFPFQLKLSPGFGVPVNKDMFCDSFRVATSGLGQAAAGGEPTTGGQRDNRGGQVTGNNGDSSVRGNDLPGLQHQGEGKYARIASARGANLSSIFSESLSANPGIRWQYVLAVQGREVYHPAWGNPGRLCHNHNTHHSEVFLATMFPHRKRVVLLLDYTTTTTTATPSGRHIGRTLTHYLLDLLTPTDRVAVVSLVSQQPRVVSPIPWESCNSHHRLNQATPTLVNSLKVLVDRETVTDGNGRSSLVRGLRTAVGVLTSGSSGFREEGTAQLLLLTSRTSNSYEIKTASEALNQAVADHSDLKIKLTVVTVPEEKENESEPNDAGPVKNQDQAMWLDSLQEALRGKSFSVHDSESMFQHKGDYYSGQKGEEVEDEGKGVGSMRQVPRVHPPSWDRVAGGRVISISQVAVHQNQPVAVVGLDVHFDELFEDVLNLPPTMLSDERVFVIDRLGQTLVHPLLSYTAAHPLQPTLRRSSASASGSSSPTVDLPPIQQLETTKDFDRALHRIKTYPSGTYTAPGGNSTYTWRHVHHGNTYIVVVAADNPSSDGELSGRRSLQLLSVPRPVSSNSNYDSYQYHEMILSGTSKLCRHMREIASMQTSALYLSPTAIAAPFSLSIDEDRIQRIQSFLAYLSDPTRLIANPGLRTGVRSDLSLVSQLTEEWKNHAYSSPLNNYIVRRRVATPHGVLLSYPGTQIVEEGGGETPTDPAREIWFRKPVAHPDTVWVSPPRLDRGGAGFIVTVSRAVLAASTNQSRKDSSRQSDLLAAVVAADFTLGYFYKIVNDTIPGGRCLEKDTRCFLLNDRGYLVAHPQLAEGFMRFTNLLLGEGQHLTHLEPYVATDILVNRDFIVKKVCRSVKNGNKLQRYFQLDTEYTGTVSNSNLRPGVGGSESCTQYQLTRVPGTNLFLGIVSEVCNTSTAFCWCSTLDRTCLDCQHWEQGECECPCECDERRSGGGCRSRGLVVDNNSYNDISEEEERHGGGGAIGPIPACPDEPRSYEPQRFLAGRHDSLPPCIHTDCTARQSEADCFGVLGCEWCSRDQDGVTGLRQPFCSYQEECFGGVLAAPSPYSRMRDQSLLMADAGAGVGEGDDRPPFRASPIGPVAGGILAFFVLLALTAWAYKHWSSGEEHGLLTRSQGSSLRINNIEEDPDDLRPPPNGGGGHHNYGLHHPIPAAALQQGGGNASDITVVSPYRMNPTYRRPRPPPGTDSDHGYSTMTAYGDQDSEIMSCLGGDPARRAEVVKLRSRNPLSLQSVTSGISSSRTSSPVQGDHELSLMSSMDKESPELPLGDGEKKQLITVENRSQLPGITVLNKHQFIVSATVHMADY